jgi:hypothetical protein
VFEKGEKLRTISEGGRGRSLPFVMPLLDFEEAVTGAFSLGVASASAGWFGVEVRSSPFYPLPFSKSIKSTKASRTRVSVA